MSMRSSTLKKSAIAGCAILAAMLAVAETSSAQEMKKVKIATSSASIPAGAARIAKEMGLFAKHGLDATASPMDTGIVATTGLVSGTFDFVTTGPSDVVVAQGRGLKVVALTSGYRGFAATLVLSKAVAEKLGVSDKAPIEQRLKALNGLTIASTSASSTFTVGPKSATEGVGAKINFTYMAQPAMIAAFQTGAIQGFIVSAPYYVVPVLNGTGLIWINGPKGDFPSASAPANSSVVIALEDYVKANPAIVKAVRDTFTDFWKAVEERPADVKAAMAKIWPELDAKTLDVVFETEAVGFKAKPLTVAEMAHEIAFMKLGGVELPQADKLNPAAMLAP